MSIQFSTLFHCFLLYTAFSTPFFLYTIYKLKDNSEGLGVFIANVCSVAFGMTVENYMKSKFGTEGEFSLLMLLYAIIAYEFLFYWFHRISHENEFVWYLFHYSHHKPKFYGLSLGGVVSIGYKLVMYSVIPAMLYMINVPIILCIWIPVFGNNLQFFVHSKHLVKYNLRFLDYIINTPSNHYLHHASNVEIINKNYGQSFMLWDHVFGTFLLGRETLKRYEHDYTLGTIREPLVDNNPFNYAFGGERILIGKILKKIKTYL